MGLFTSVGAVVGVGTLIAQGLRKASKESHSKNSLTQSFATETLNNMKTVRSFSGEDYHMEKYEALNKVSTQSATKLNNGIAIFQGLTNLALNAIVGGTTIGCGVLVGSGKLSAGDLMSFIASAQLLMKNLSTLSQIMTAYVKMGISGDRVFEHLDLSAGETTTHRKGFYACTVKIQMRGFSESGSH